MIARAPYKKPRHVNDDDDDKLDLIVKCFSLNFRSDGPETTVVGKKEKEKTSKEIENKRSLPLHRKREREFNLKAYLNNKKILCTLMGEVLQKLHNLIYVFFMNPLIILIGF